MFITIDSSQCCQWYQSVFTTNTIASFGHSPSALIVSCPDTPSHSINDYLMWLCCRCWQQAGPTGQWQRHPWTERVPAVTPSSHYTSSQRWVSGLLSPTLMVVQTDSRLREPGHKCSVAGSNIIQSKIYGFTEHLKWNYYFHRSENTWYQPFHEYDSPHNLDFITSTRFF